MWQRYRETNRDWILTVMILGCVIVSMLLGFLVDIHNAPKVHAQTRMQFTQIVSPKLEIFQNLSNTYDLSSTPYISNGIAPMVYVNGLLMASGVDYNIDDKTITFGGINITQMEQVTVQVLYWTVLQQ